MGAKANKVLKKKLKITSSKLAVAKRTNEQMDFLPLKGGPARKIPQREEPVKDTAKVLYIGHIPHGFYEDEMEGFFKQFGKIRRLRVARNKRTGKSKHFGFIEFENPEVAKVVADEIHGYLVFEHTLQIFLIPPEHVHPYLFKGVNQRYVPPNWREIARKQHNKEKTGEEHQRMVKGILKRDEMRRKRIAAAGIDYECPDIMAHAQPAPKKIKFIDDDEDWYRFVMRIIFAY